MRNDVNGRPRRSSWLARLVLGVLYVACVIGAWALVLTLGYTIADVLTPGAP